jgi:hypothetical protein
MADTLLWGNTRPRIRIGTSAQTNGTNYVFNQPPALVPDEHFPKHIILNESCLNIYLNEHIIKRRGIFTFDYELLDRPSCERLIDILNSSTAKYLRPHFNFHKEYQVRCVNEWELDNLEKSNQSYKGILQFETIAGESSIPSESSGSFSFNGSTKIANTLASTLTGDCVVEMWIKTPSAFSVKEELFSMTSAGVAWTISINTNGTIEFVTDDGSSDTLTTENALSASTWYFVVVSRVDTDTKTVYVNGVSWGTQDDSKAANSITATQLSETSNGFSGLCQIYRIYNDSFSGVTQYPEHSIEAINSSYLSNIKLWWDFSQGSATDLSAEENDGTVTGTETYQEESFPDNGEEYMT